MNIGLKNKIVLITGSSKGLGFATAKQLAKEGAKVIISSSNEANVKDAVINIQKDIENPNNVTGAALDLSNTKDIKAFVEQQASLYNGIDILITNTAGPKSGELDSIELSDVTKAYNQLVAPVFELIKNANKYLKNSDNASILNIASISVKQPIPGLLLSNILRPMVAALSKDLSQELGPLGIRVNSILPGWISTDRSKTLLNSKNKPFKQSDIEKNIPLRRIGTPEEFANAASFLVSPAASYINGIMLPVDGGLISSLS